MQACKLKLGDFKGALLDADFAIRDGDDNPKALFRQGQVGISTLGICLSLVSFPQLDQVSMIKPF